MNVWPELTSEDHGLCRKSFIGGHEKFFDKNSSTFVGVEKVFKE